MRHTSVKLNTPVEFIQLKPVNPLISKCQIKVCYVGEDPNRNNSIITKEVATEMANSLPGSPIVGFFNEEKGDFEGHNRELVVEEDNFYFKDTTRPFGFVDLGAPVWFQKFLDDGVEHEYLMTEGYLWTGQYPEAARVIEKGNGQSMELDTDLTTGYWSEGNNEKPEFFIINEAIISKLCILGDDVEPCFEGASVTSMQFSFDEGFKQELFSLMEQMKKLLKEGETSMENTVKDDSVLETAAETNPEEVEELEGAELEGAEAGEPAETPAEEGAESDAAEEGEGVADPAAAEGADDSAAGEVAETGAEENEMTYTLEEIPEYVELSQKYSALETEYASLNANIESLNAELATLRDFKLGVERKDKESMIASFYMLTDEDKADVVSRIDELSVSDIEKELSVICVRNKVNFNLEDDTKPVVTTFNLDSNNDEVSTPAWINAVKAVAKEMN